MSINRISNGSSRSREIPYLEEECLSKWARWDRMLGPQECAGIMKTYLHHSRCCGETGRQLSMHLGSSSRYKVDLQSDHDLRAPPRLLDFTHNRLRGMLRLHPLLRWQSTKPGRALDVRKYKNLERTLSTNMQYGVSLTVELMMCPHCD